jgi:bifunctional non-homologous end joining protein LigD
MLCTLLKAPFQHDNYLYEIKWDGYRIIAYKNDNVAWLKSRSNLDYSKKYPAIVNALLNLKADVILDGEIVTLNEEGVPDFDELQTVNGQAKRNLYYYVFDLLWIDGKSIMSLPLVERKAALKDLVKNNPVIKYSDDFHNGLALFEQVKKLGLEGIIAKRKESQYQPDKRGNDWYKIPYEIKQEFVVGGWVESERRAFRTLLFGANDEKGLKWIGHAGGGFKEKDMPAILKKLN